ncbi:MAG: tetratricopeptide repeat protein [Pirellulaceae bacterium]
MDAPPKVPFPTAGARRSGFAKVLAVVFALLLLAVGGLLIVPRFLPVKQPVDKPTTGNQGSAEDSINAGNGAGTTAESRLLRSGEKFYQRALALKDSNPQEALELLNTAADYPQSKARSLALAGELLLKVGDPNTAVGVLQAALAADDQLIDPHRWLAAYFYDIGAMDDALIHLKATAAKDPSDPRPWRMQGLIYADFERYAEAIPAYEEALQREMAEHVQQEVRIELADTYLAFRQPDLALKHLDECTATPKTLSMRADCELALGNEDEAEVALHSALELDPKYAPALLIQASLERERGQLAAAAKTYEMAIQLQPYEPDIRSHLMAVYNALGQEAQAEEQRAQMQRLRDLRTRFTELHHLSMKDPSSAMLRLELGETALALGKNDLAISWFKAALALEPENSTAIEALRNLLDIE